MIPDNIFQLAPLFLSYILTDASIVSTQACIFFFFRLITVRCNYVYLSDLFFTLCIDEYSITAFYDVICETTKLDFAFRTARPTFFVYVRANERQDTNVKL